MSNQACQSIVSCVMLAINEEEGERVRVQKASRLVYNNTDHGTRLLLTAEPIELSCIR